MKKYDDLFDKICTYENFRLAYKNASKGKQHYKEVKLINRNIPKYIRRLLAEVKEQRYIVSDYDIFKRWTGHKEREIYKLPMKDRIVQHAVMNIIEPIFRETFIQDTYSSIKERGIHRGLHRVKRCLNKYHFKYCLKCDVHKCYPSLDQDILKAKLAQKFKDKRLLDLLYKIVDSCDKGVPIGNYTSQYFNNFYFSKFDHWIKEVKRIKGYFRYCDDLVLLGNSKEELRLLYQEIVVEMSKLNVKLKDNYQIFSIQDRSIDFLGYKIRESHILLRKYTKENFISKVKKMDLNNLTEKDINILGSYYGILIHGNCRNLWYKYIGVKTFKDLNVSVHERDFIKNIIGKTIVVHKALIYVRKGERRIKLTVDYDEKKNILVSTSGECLIEAIENINRADYPFSTVIDVSDKGYYIFT